MFENEIHQCEYLTDVCSARFDNDISTYIQLRDVGGLFTEKQSASFFEQIDRFFRGIIASMRRFAESITQQAAAKVRTKQMKAALRQLNATLHTKKAAGAKKVEMIDFWTLDKLFDSYYRKMKSMADKLIQNRYKHLKELDADLSAFMKLADEADKEIASCMDQKIEVSINKAISFCEDQITGRDQTFNRLNNTIQEIEDMERGVIKIKDERDIKGMDILPEKGGIIRRMITRLSKFITNTVGKRLAKGIAAVVFLFA